MCKRERGGEERLRKNRRKKGMDGKRERKKRERDGQNERGGGDAAVENPEHSATPSVFGKHGPRRRKR